MLKASFPQWERNNHAIFIAWRRLAVCSQNGRTLIGNDHVMRPTIILHHYFFSQCLYVYLIYHLSNGGFPRCGFETHLAEKEWVRITSKPFSFFVCFALFCLFVCFLTGELPKCLWFGISSSVDISTQVVSGKHSSNPVETETFLGNSFPYFSSSLS